MGRKSHETGCLFLSAVVVRIFITSSPLPMPVGWLKQRWEYAPIAQREAGKRLKIVTVRIRISVGAPTYRVIMGS